MSSNLAGLVRPLLYIVTVTLIPQFGLRPVWITAFSVVLVAYRLYLDQFQKPMPPRWLQWCGQIVVAVAIWQHFHSFLGDEAGGAFLTLLLCVKTFELKRKRDFFVTAILCLLVLMSYLLLDQGLLLTAFLFFDTALVFTFLHALEMEGWTWSNWKTTLRSTIWLAVKGLPLLVVMFVLFPRFSTGFGSSNTSVGTTGVTDSLRPGAVSKLVGSNELVFRATFLNGEMPQLQQLYWRGAVLDQSSGLNWDRSKYDRVFAVPYFYVERPDVEIYLEPGSERFLFSLDQTQSLLFPNDTEISRMVRREGGIFELAEPLQTRDRYYITLAKGNVDSFNETYLEHYLELGEEASPQLKKFLQPFESKTAGEAVRGLLETFHDGGYRYSMQPPSSKGLEDFLFNTKIGFCEHYAGTFATLLRHLHIPSRVVVGFQGGTPSLLDNYISVRGHDAHAWVEYFDAKERRWRRVDPTAQVAPLRLTQGSSSYYETSGQRLPGWLGNWTNAYQKGRAILDEVEASWIGLMLRFDLARQRQLLAKLGMEGVFFRALAVFLLLGLALVLSVIYFVEAWRREPMSVDENLYRTLLRHLERWKIVKRPNEGPTALMAKVEAYGPRLAAEVEPILTTLVRVRFGQSQLDQQAVAELRRRLKRLRQLSPTKY